MAVTVNGSVLTQTDVTSPSPSTLTYTSVVLTAGDILVAVTAENSPSTFGTFSAPTGGTGLSWTQIILQQNTASHFSEVVAYWSNIPSDQTSTITVSTTNTSDVGTGGALFRLSGADQVTPIGLTDGFQGQTDPTGTDLQLSGTQTGSLIIAAASDWSAGTASLTISISNTTGGTTDLSNLESGQFRAIVNHGSQSGSTNQGTYDYSAATGDWAAIIFEIKAASAVAGGIPFAHPGKTWERQFHHRQALFPSVAAVDIRSDIAESEFGLSADATVKKVAVVTAISSLGLTSTVTAKKVAPATGLGTVGLASNFTHVEIHPITALATVGFTSTSTAKKVTPTISVGTVGLVSTATAKKVGKATLVATAGLAGIVTARKVAPATGRGVVGLQASFAHIEIHPITALAALGATAYLIGKKRSNPLAAGTVGLSGNALPKKISKSTDIGMLPLTSQAVAFKRQAIIGRSSLGLMSWWDKTITGVFVIAYVEVIGTSTAGTIGAGSTSGPVEAGSQGGAVDAKSVSGAVEGGTVPARLPS